MELTEEQIRRIAKRTARVEAQSATAQVANIIGGGPVAQSTEAQHAKEADHAAAADTATTADTAKEADHAKKAAALDDSALDQFDDKFLRKDKDDETTHKLGVGALDINGGDLNIKSGTTTYGITKEGIAKLAGAVVDYLKSSDFSKGTGVGFDGSGFGITKDAAGKWTLEIDKIAARIKMIVAELEVHEMTFIGGTVVMSACGNRMAVVEALDGNGNVIDTANSDKPALVIPEGQVADKFRCYFLASDGDRQIKNEWTVGQLARCKTNNLAKPGDYTNYENREYWRLVVAVSDAPVTIEGKNYHYIELSNSTSKEIYLTDKEGTTREVSLGGVCESMASLPYAGDNVIGFGHCWDTNRQNIAILSMLEGGWVIYKNISAYDLPRQNIVNKFGIDEAIVTTDHFILRPYAAPSEMQTVAVVRGAYDDMANYGHNDMVTLDGQTWIASGVAIGKTITGQKPAINSSYWSLAAAKGDGATVAKLVLTPGVIHIANGDTGGTTKVRVDIVVIKGGTNYTLAAGNTDYYCTLNGGSHKFHQADDITVYHSVSSNVVRLYKNDNTNIVLDTVTIPVIEDGKDGDGDPGVSYMFSVIKKELRINLPSGGGKISDNGFTLSWNINMNLCKLTGSSDVAAVGPDSFKTYWLFADGTNMETNGLLKQSGSTISGNGTQEDYNITSSSRVVGLRVDAIVGGNVVVQQQIDASIETGSWLNKTNEAISMGVTNGESISNISAKADDISLKVQDLQSGGIDTSKPHTSSQVDFTSLSADSFYPVLIKFKGYDAVRHTVEINRPLKAAYGSGKGYMTHGQGFSFRLVFSDIANGWGSYEGGQLRIDSISQFWTSPSDTPICPKITQYNNFSIIVAWLRGGSKYDITVDCVDAYISGIWPYMMQVASNPSWVPDAVRFASAFWTTAQINAQGDNAYNLLKHDNGGFYADTDNEYLYRFGNLTAGHTFAIVGQPKDSKQWFMATWHIASVSGSKVYVDISSYSIVWQTQNPLGIRMDGTLGYIKKGVSYSKSTWDSEQGFGTYERLNNTAVHANWAANRFILVIGEESSATDGVYRDRAVIESVETCSEGSSVSFYSRSYFDVSPLYGTDGRTNVKTDMLATGIDIKSHKITATTDNFVVRSNSGTTTFTIDKDGNIVGAGNASFKGTVFASGGSFTGTVTGAKIVGSTLQSSDGTNTTTIQGGSITTNSIFATGGTISFFKFDQEGLYTPYTEGDNGAKWNGIGMSINNISVSGNSNNRISSVYLGNGMIDSRWSNSNNRTTYRAGSTSLGSTFYNYIKLEKINSSYNSFENDPEHAAFGVETQGDVCITGLGGPSCFQGLCLPSASGSSSMTADGKRTMYLFSGGDFNMPSNPPGGLEIKVIQTGSKITFHANGHRFRNGRDYSDTFTSNTRGQWNFFYFDGFNWHWNYMNN